MAASNATPAILDRNIPARKNAGHVRPIRVEGQIAYVPLTGGYEAMLDASDVHLVAHRNWFAERRTNTTYARWSGKKAGAKWSVKMHQVIMGSDAEDMVDHVNGNGLDNRRENLVFTSRSANSRNTARRRMGRVPNIRFDPRRGVYEGRIHIGSFPTREAAASAITEAEITLGLAPHEKEKTPHPA